MNLEFVADADNFIPPHSTGAAVDLYIFNTETNQPLDMGSPINYPDDKSWTYNFKDLADVQMQNRLFLTKFMIEHGFANLASEWWHYSYGDQYWAMFYDKESCLFDSIKQQ
jgi:D-alanyl-D-alanine dipeptidase